MIDTPITIRMILEKTVMVTHDDQVDPERVVDDLFQLGQIPLTLEDDLVLEDTTILEDERGKDTLIHTMNIVAKVVTSIVGETPQ